MVTTPTCLYVGANSCVEAGAHMGSWLKRIAPNVVMRSGLLYGYRSGHDFRKE